MSVRIVDRELLTLAVLQSLLSSLAALICFSYNLFAFGALMIVTLFFGIVGSFQAAKGVVFESSSISFHQAMLRRTVALNEVKAANCEFGLRFSPALLIFFAFAMFGGGSGKPRDRESSLLLRAYMVNLSGDFGSAQVRFYGKRWRDTFLMTLRERAPRCRITRWS